MECQCPTFYPNVIIDNDETIDKETVDRYLLEKKVGCKLLTTQECEDLIACLYDTGYISHEFHPRVHGIITRIERFINENTTKNKGTKVNSRK